MLEGLLDGIPTTWTGWVMGIVGLAAGVVFSLWMFLEYAAPLAKSLVPGPDPERRAAEFWAEHRNRATGPHAEPTGRSRSSEERLADRVAEDLTEALRNLDS